MGVSHSTQGSPGMSLNDQCDQYLKNITVIYINRKKIMNKLMILFIAVGMLVGCGSEDSAEKIKRQLKGVGDKP